MKNMKLFISLVLVVIMCVVLAGCASNRPSGGNEGWSDPSNPGNHEWTDPDKPGDQDWDDPSNPGDHDWPDPYNPGDKDWPDVDDPSETTEPSNPGQTGNYRHEIDGVVFYTEHSVDEWIDGDVFHAIDMANDIFGNGEKYTYGMGAVAFNINGVESVLAYEVKKADGNPTSQPTDNAYPHFMIQQYYVYEYGDYGNLYLIDNSAFYIPYELLELSLFACEQLQAGNDSALSELHFVSGHIEIQH